MKIVLNILLLCCPLLIVGQVVNEQVVSKVDLNAQYQLWDGNQTKLMGYTRLLSAPINLPAPTLTFNEGDSVNLTLWNMSQNAPHTIHLHGLDVNQQNDGVPSLSWEVYHSQMGTYEFVAPHAGTYIYHCHVATAIHLQGGMYGLLIVRPPNGDKFTWAGGYAYDKEYAWMLSEIDTVWHTDSLFNHPYDTNNTMMPIEVPDFNPQYFLVNGKSEQQLVNDTTVAINDQANSNIYLRLAGIGYCGNKIIFPSALNAQIVSSDGRPLPSAINTDTVELYPGERYGVMLSPTTEFADSIQVEYSDLNNHQVKSVQMVPVNISGFVGVEEVELDFGAVAYPNPNDGEFSIDVNGFNEGEISLTVLNAVGKAVEEMTVLNSLKGRIDLNLSHLGKGIYFIQLNQNKKTSTIKTIIN